MKDRLRPLFISLLLLWTVLLCWQYGTSLARAATSGVSLTRLLLQRSGVLVAGGLAVALPAAGLRHLERSHGRSTAAGILLLVVGVLAAAIAWLAQVLAPFAAAVLFVASAYGYGAAAARWVQFEELRHTWQGVPLLAALGWAILIVAGLAVGTVGLLTKPVIGGLLLIGMALAVASRQGPPGPRSQPPGGLHDDPSIALWWGLAILMLIGLVGAVAPEIRYDALVEHLPIARVFARAARIVEVRENLASYFQLNGVLLYAMGMTLVPGAELPKLLHFLAGALATLLTYSVGDRLWGSRVGLAAAFIVAGTPLVWWLGETGSTDLWLTLFVTGAVECLVLFTRRPGPGPAFTVGLLAGAAAGTKVSSVAAALPIMAVLLTWMVASRDRQSSWVWALAAGWALTGTYFYARAWVLTGNPIFPLLNGHFKSPYAPSTTVPSFVAIFGMGHGPLDLLLLPWRVTRFPARFIEDSNIGVAYLALLPAALVAIGRDRVPRWLTGVALAAGLLWFGTGQYLRFLLPVLPLAALLGTAGLLADPRPRRAALLSGVVLMLAVGAGAAAWVASGPWNFPISVVRGTTSREEYTIRYVPDFEMATYVRKTLPESARIYALNADLTFYYDRFVVPTSWHGSLFNREVGTPVRNARTGGEVQAILTRAGFTHLLVHMSPAQPRGDQASTWLGRAAFDQGNPLLIHASNGYYLFELRPPPR